MSLERKGRWVGPLHFTTCRQAYSAPRVDGCCCHVVDKDSETGNVVGEGYARGYAVRYRGREALVVAVRSKHPGCPRTPKAWLRHKRLMMRGPKTLAGVDATSGTDNGNYLNVTAAAKHHGIGCDRAYRITDGTVPVEGVDINLRSNEFHAFRFVKDGLTITHFAPASLPLDEQLEMIACRSK